MEVVEIYSPNPAHAKELASALRCHHTDSLQKLRRDSDLYLIAVPDKKVTEVAGKMQTVDGIVAHTSGITSIDALSGFTNYGVFYPLQTFSRGRKLDISEIPFCLEGNDKNVMEALTELAARISKVTHHIDSGQRMILHLAAVLVNNFSNHLYHLAEDFLEKRKLDFDLLRPLILETAAKAQDLPPGDSQTGPARRGDASTISKHLELLEDDPGIRNLYELLSEQIRKKYHE